jgi:hypothetical protein
MTKIKDYSMKYKFQWWWYSNGGQELVENVTGTAMIFGFAYAMWWLAYLLEP